MGYSLETEVEEEFESEYDDSEEDIFDSPWSPFRSILPYPRFAFLPSLSFLDDDDDSESEWEVGWRRTPRISKKAVDAMPMVKIDRSINCPICLEEFAIGEEAKEMPCKHRFHGECIVPWLETHCSCPLCRFEMPADNELEDSDESDGADGDRVEVDDDSGRRESRRRFLFLPALRTHGYRNESDGGADDDGRAEGDDDYRFGFFPSLWSNAYENSYWNGSDGGVGDDDDDDGVGGDDGIRNGRQGFRSYLRRRLSLLCRSNKSFYPMRIPFSSTLRGKFSLDTTKCFSWRISTSVFQGMHSKKFSGFHELDEYSTTAMRTTGNERCYKFTMYKKNWINPSGKMDYSLRRDFASPTKETDQTSSF